MCHEVDKSESRRIGKGITVVAYFSNAKYISFYSLRKLGYLSAGRICLFILCSVHLAHSEHFPQAFSDYVVTSRPTSRAYMANAVDANRYKTPENPLASSN